MDIIKKRINLETYKNHTPAFFPYIKVYNDGKWHEKSGSTTDAVVIPIGGSSNSWGNVLCNMVGLSGTTAELLAKYYEINTILKTGVKMKRMVLNDDVIIYVDTFEDQVKSYTYQVSNMDYLEANKPGVYKLISGETEGDFVIFLENDSYFRYIEIGGADFISYVEENILGLIRVEFAPGSMYYGEDIIGDLVPEKFYLSAIPKWLNWFNENIPGKDDECDCYESEWVKRGGEKMIAFLQENEYRLSKFRTTPEVIVPELSIPVFLSQNYDDNGIMSVYDETPYNKSLDTGRTEYERYYEPYTSETINTESKLQTLRSNIKMFDDNGNLLPYIDINSAITSGVTYGYLPYREKEGFNISYDVNSGEYVADYIVGKENDVEGIKMVAHTSDGRMIDLNKEIPLKKNGEAISKDDDITGITVDFTYIIGGVYNQNKGKISIKNNIETIPSETGETDGAITINANEPWVILSNTSSFYVSPSSGLSGTHDLKLVVNDRNKSTTNDRLLTVVAATKGRIHDEVMCTIIQEHSVPPAICSFNGSLPTMITFTNETAKTITVRCDGSGWYLKSKPSFMEVEPTTGKDGTNTTIRLICQPLPEETTMREGILEFVATDNSNVTYKPTVRQGVNIIESFVASIVGGSEIESGDTKEVIGITTDGQPFTINNDWGYRVLDTLYANDIFITHGDTGMTFTNKGTKSETISVSVQIYNKKTPSVSSIVTAKLVGTVSILITPSQSQAIEAWSEKTFTVSVSGDDSDNWEPYVTGDGSGSLTVNRTSYNTFKLTNENDSGVSLTALVCAKSTTRENVESNKVSLTLKPKPMMLVKCCIAQENYSCDFDVDIWASCEGDEPIEGHIANFNCGGECPNESESYQSWEESANEIPKDKNNKYYIRFNEITGCTSRKCDVYVYDFDGNNKEIVPLINISIIPVMWECDLTDFIKGNTIYIKFVIKGKK